MRNFTSLPHVEYKVADGHYDTSRKPINKIVLHSSASTTQGLINTFTGGTRMVAAHYGIDNDGNILAFVSEMYTAYHAGNYAVNQSSIGIEHVDEGSTVRKHTDAQYNTSIKLLADICTYYNIPADKDHVVPHSSITATSCPNGLDVNRIISGASAIINGSIMEQLPKDSVIKDIRTALCGSYSQDEIDADIASNKNLVEITTGICQGDQKFYDKWVKPHLPTTSDTNTSQNTPSDPTGDSVTGTDSSIIQKVLDGIRKLLGLC